MGEENVTTCRIVEGDPLSATVITRVEVPPARPGSDACTVAACATCCDAERLIVATTLDAFGNGVRIHAFPRDGA